MTRQILAVLALALSNVAIASESVSFVCNATSMEATSSGNRFAYQVKGIGFRSRSIPNDTPTLNASAASIDVYQISSNGTVSVALKNGSLTSAGSEELCDNDFCSIAKSFNASQSTFGLKAITVSSRHQPSSSSVWMDFIVEHKLSSSILSRGHGHCEVESLEVDAPLHSSDIMVDVNGKFVLIPNSENELPTLINDQALATTFFDLVDAEGFSSNENVRGGFIASATRNPRTGKVAIGIEHIYRMLSSYSAIYVFDPATQTIANVPYQLNGRTIPAGMTDSLDSVSSLAYDRSGLLHAFVGDAAGNRFQMMFSPALRYLGCKTLEIVEGSPSACLRN